MKRSLRFKLLAGFVLVAMFTGALGSYSVATMQQLNLCLKAALGMP